MAASRLNFVIDASMVMALLYPDEKQGTRAREVAEKITNRSNKFSGTVLLTYEVGNALVMGLKRKRLTLATAGGIWDDFKVLPIVQVEIDENEVLEFAVNNDLTYYDAAYVWLALKKKAELMSLDEKMMGVWKKLRSNEGVD